MLSGLLIVGLAVAPGQDLDPGLGFVLLAANRPLTANCEAEWRPERAVLPGAVSASALKPTEARLTLDRQLELMRAFLTERGGVLRLLERTRAVRGSARDVARPEAGAPFVMVQRLEGEAPADADVDALLEGLLKLGLDQFGSDVSLDPGSRGGHLPPQAAVRFRIQGLREKIADLRDRCRGLALASWCESNVAYEERTACAAALKRSAARFVVQSFEVRSAAVPRGEGGFAPIFFTASTPEAWRADRPGLDGRDSVDLLGLVPLSVRAAITVQLVAGL